MSTIYHYASVSEALLKLREKGFTFDFNQNEEDIILHPENYTINHIYHYEGNSNPDDAATVYGIVSKYGLKGVFASPENKPSVLHQSKLLRKITGYTPSSIENIDCVGYKKAQAFCNEHFFMIDRYTFDL